MHHSVRIFFKHLPITGRAYISIIVDQITMSKIQHARSAVYVAIVVTTAYCWHEQETDDTAVVKPTSLLCILVECCSTTRSFSAHSFNLLPSIVAASNQRRPPFCFFPPSHSRLKIKTSRLYFKRCSLICNMPSLLVLMSFTKLLQLST